MKNIKISIFSLIDIALTCYMAYLILSLWLYPQANDVELIYNLATLMAFEFIMVHSGVFMSFLGRSWKAWLGAIIFYGLFALVFNLFVTDNRILFLYAGVVLNRMLSGIMTSDETAKEKRIGFSALYAVIYFLLIMFVGIYSFLIPEFGLTESFLQSSDYHDMVIHGGSFTDTPHIAMCFGVLYYASLSLVAVYALFYRPKPVVETPPDEEEKPFFHPKIALGFGIASIVLSFFIILGGILGIIGVASSALTIKQYRETPEKYARKSYIIAQIGKICSIIGIILGFLLIFAIMFGIWKV